MRKILVLSLMFTLAVLCQGCGRKSELLVEDMEQADDKELICFEEKSDLYVYYEKGVQEKFFLITREAEGNIDLGLDVDDLKTITVSAWGESGTFIAIHIEDKEYTHTIRVFENENLSEIEIASPYKTALRYIKQEIDMEQKTLFLQLADEKRQFSFSDKEAIKAIAESIKVGSSITFAQNDTGLYCDIPILYGNNKELGVLRQYYEYDGIGLSSISAEYYD